MQIFDSTKTVCKLSLSKITFQNTPIIQKISGLFFITEKNPQTRTKITKLRHPWNIVFQNYNLEWPSTVQDIITPEKKCEGMDNCNKTTPYVELELNNLTTLFTVDT